MDLGLFFMPLHRPEKPYRQALKEDREAILLADRAGYAETWVGEHFSTKAEPIPAPLIFLATLIDETTSMRFGTGVVNMGHRHPVVVAAEAALFDQLSDGRLMLGVGPGGLNSDAELLGRADKDERFAQAMESIDMVIEAWTQEPPLNLKGEYWSASLESEIWRSYGVGQLPKPQQQPHPPLAMAMVSPSGRTVDTIAERGFIPISANFVPVQFVHDQWESYTNRRHELGLEADRSIWRVCRSILITDSDAEAEELLADPDGTFAFYFRYLRGVAQVSTMNTEYQDHSIEQLNEVLGIQKMLDRCVIAGSADTVRDRLIEMVDYLGPFGTLVSTGHDWDETDRFAASITRLAADVAPDVAQHMASLEVSS